MNGMQLSYPCGKTNIKKDVYTEVDFKFIFRIQECVTTATALHGPDYVPDYICPFLEYTAYSHNVDRDEKYS